jgi:hypothetical protein
LSATRAASIRHLIAALSLLAVRPAAAGSGSGTLSGETFIHSRFPNNNNGGCTYVAVGRDGVAGLIRGVIEFSLPLPTPAYAGRVTVTGAILNNVTVVGLPNGMGIGIAETYFIERLTGTFTQGNGCGAQATGTYLVGVPCNTVSPQGATWNTSNCSTMWTAGGAVIGSPVSSALSGSTLRWDSGGGGTNCLTQPQLCTDIQTFIDAGVATGGWRIRNSETVNGHAQTFSHSGTLAFNWTCKAGYLDTGTTCTTCTAAARNACAITCPATGGTCINGQPSGNTCNDIGAPSTSYTCTCSNPAYTGTGTTSCTDKNACVGSPCASGGNTSAACTDAVAPNTGYSCSCSTGFSFDGTTCISQCRTGMNPCGANGDAGSSCAVVGTGGWTCTCGAGYVSSGGVTPTCVDFNACTASGNAACVTTCPSTGGTCTAGMPSGNACNDLAPPSLGYACSCNNAAYTVTGTSCIDKNACNPNHCGDGGDTGALVACSDAVAPGIGYTCTCDTGFTFDGTTCVSQCSGGANPCNQNGETNATCTVVGSGGWTCGCSAGFVSTGGVLPTCTNLDACTPQALLDCATTLPGNQCVDEAPPSNTYHCICGDPGSIPIPGVADAGPRCQHIEQDADVGKDADAADDADVGASTDVGAIDAQPDEETRPISEAGPPDADSSAPAADAESLDARSDDARVVAIDASQSDASRPSDASNGPGQGAADEGGCGCRVAPGRHGLAARAALTLSCLLMLFARRRRRHACSGRSDARRPRHRVPSDPM